MATGLIARYTAAQDQIFQTRVAEAMAEAAVAINAEAVTAKTPARVAYAAQVLNDPPGGLMAGGGGLSKHVAAFALALVTQGIDGGSTDGAIGNGVSAVWNALAGA
jgi:hypothetical protein